jgi:hypothetical protein
MNELQTICLEFIAIASLVIGSVGVLVSVLLLAAPERLKSVGLLMNRSILVEKKFADLNVTLPTGGFTYRHNHLFGAALILGSAFVLVFLFRELELPATGEPINEILIHSLTLLGKVSSFVGIIIGLFLLFAPEAMQRIENAMNRSFDTQHLVDNLNSPLLEMDNVFFRFPKLLGTFGLIASMTLVYLGIQTLHRPPMF